MNHYPVVVGVAAVAMGGPVSLAQVKLHVAADQAQPLNFQKRVAEVRPCGDARRTGV